MFKDICFKQGTQFRYVCSSSGPIYYAPASSSFGRQMPCANYFIIIIYYKDFLYFFPNQYFENIVSFCVLAKENQEALSERCFLVTSVLQGLNKICKKYMEVNHFLLLICRLEK